MTFKKIQFPQILNLDRTSFDCVKEGIVSSADLDGCELSQILDLRKCRLSTCTMADRKLFLIMVMPNDFDMRSYVGSGIDKDQHDKYNPDSVQGGLSAEDLLWRKELGLLSGSGGNALLSAVQNKVLGGDLKPSVICGSTSRTVAQLWYFHIVSASLLPPDGVTTVHSIVSDPLEVDRWNYTEGNLFRDHLVRSVTSIGRFLGIEQIDSLKEKTILNQDLEIPDGLPYDICDSHGEIELAPDDNISVTTDTDFKISDESGLPNPEEILDLTDEECSKDDKIRKNKNKFMRGFHNVRKEVQSKSKSQLAKLKSGKIELERNKKSEKKSIERSIKLASRIGMSSMRRESSQRLQCHDQMNLSITLRDKLSLILPVSVMLRHHVESSQVASNLIKNLLPGNFEGKSAADKPLLNDLFHLLLRPSILTNKISEFTKNVLLQEKQNTTTDLRKIVGLWIVASFNEQLVTKIGNPITFKEIIKVEGVIEEGHSVEIDLEQLFDRGKIQQDGSNNKPNLIVLKEGVFRSFKISITVNEPEKKVLYLPRWYAQVCSLSIDIIITLPTLLPSEKRSSETTTLRPGSSPVYDNVVEFVIQNTFDRVDKIHRPNHEYETLLIASFIPMRLSAMPFDENNCCNIIPKRNLKPYSNYMPEYLKYASCSIEIEIQLDSNALPLDIARDLSFLWSPQPIFLGSFLQRSRLSDAIGTGEDTLLWHSEEFILIAQLVVKQTIKILDRITDLIESFLDLVSWQSSGGYYHTIYWLLVGFMFIQIGNNLIGTMLLIWAWYVVMMSIGNYLTQSPDCDWTSDCPMLWLLCPWLKVEVLSEADNLARKGYPHSYVKEDVSMQQLIIHAESWSLGFRGSELYERVEQIPDSKIRTSNINSLLLWELRPVQSNKVLCLLTCIPPQSELSRSSREMTVLTLISGMLSFFRLIFITVWGGFPSPIDVDRLQQSPHLKQMYSDQEDIELTREGSFPTPRGDSMELSSIPNSIYCEKVNVLPPISFRSSVPNNVSSDIQQQKSQSKWLETVDKNASEHKNSDVDIDFLTDALFFIVSKWPMPGSNINFEGLPGSFTGKGKESDQSDEQGVIKKKHIRRSLILGLQLADLLLNFWKNDFHKIKRAINYISDPSINLSKPLSHSLGLFDIDHWARYTFLMWIVLKGLFLIFFVPLNWYLIYVVTRIVAESWHNRRRVFWNPADVKARFWNHSHHPGISLLRRIKYNR